MLRIYLSKVLDMNLTFKFIKKMVFCHLPVMQSLYYIWVSCHPYLSFFLSPHLSHHPLYSLLLFCPHLIFCFSTLGISSSQCFHGNMLSSEMRNRHLVQGLTAAEHGLAKSLQSCLTFWDPMDIARHASLSMRFPGKNTGVGCHVVLQGIFPTQGLNPDLPHCGWILYHLSHQGSPSILE